MQLYWLKQVFASQAYESDLEVPVSYSALTALPIFTFCPRSNLEMGNMMFTVLLPTSLGADGLRQGIGYLSV